MKKKKILITLTILVVLLFAGGWAAKLFITNKMYDAVSTYLDDPEIQKQIAELTEEDIQKTLDELDTDKLIEEAGVNVDELPDIDVSIPPDVGGTEQPAVSSTPKPAGNATTKPAATSTGKAGEATNKPATTSKPATKNLDFNDRNDAANYAMKKFKASEVVDYMSKYKNRDKLTSEEKQQIKKDVLSKFTAEEIRALSEAAK